MRIRADAAGLERPKILDGRSFVPVLIGKTDAHKTQVRPNIRKGFAVPFAGGITLLLAGLPSFGSVVGAPASANLRTNLDAWMVTLTPPGPPSRLQREGHFTGAEILPGKK